MKLQVLIVGPAKTFKSTAALHIAKALEKIGFKTKIIDQDKLDAAGIERRLNCGDDLALGVDADIEVAQTNRRDLRLDSATTGEPQTYLEFQKLAHQNSVNKGFWPTLEESIEEEDPAICAQKIALMHSELSEVLEAHRHKNPQSEKIPAFSHMEEELADLQIRLWDFAERYKLDVLGASRAKHEFNTRRPHKHGKGY